MSALTLLSVFLVLVSSTTAFTATSADRLERIESNIISIDHKLQGYSNDIFMLKNDVAETNRKLDLLLEMTKGTTSEHHASNYVDTASGNDRASDPISKLNDLKATVKSEISRVRRAFVTEKTKLMQQQKRNNIQFLEFSNQLNDTLAILHDRHDTKWTLAADSINNSVVTVLGAVRDNIDNQLVQWNQSIHDNLKEQTNTTLATLNVLNHTIDSWSDIIHRTVNDVDVTVSDLINKSMVQHDNLTKTLQTKLISSLTVIEDTVRSMDYSDTLSFIVDSLQSHDNKTERLLNYAVHTHDKVRLVNSTSRNQGRLEVYINGQWGTVCDDRFDNTDASVACNMLGYVSGRVHVGLPFGAGTLPIIMDEVQCTGKEHYIEHCTYITDHDCTHPEDVGVMCYH